MLEFHVSSFGWAYRPRGNKEYIRCSNCVGNLRLAAYVICGSCGGALHSACGKCVPIRTYSYQCPGCVGGD